MKRNPQVSIEHYRLEKYVTYERWQSYFNQVREVLRYNPKSVLIIGPGDGIVVNILKGYGLEVHTVDIDEANKPDFLASVDDLKGAGTLPDRKYDVVVCSQVLEHLPYENFQKCLESIKAFTGRVAIISLPEKSLRASISLKLPKINPFFLNFVIPFYWVKHKFGGEHYWELNAQITTVKKIVADMEKVFHVRKYYRLKTNPYHFFFILENKTAKRIFLLSDGKNPHTIKWARSLAERKFEIFIFSLNSFDFKLYGNHPNIQCFHAGFEENASLKGFKKIIYLQTLSRLRKEVKDFNPDILHSHFASSYGLLGALIFFKPFFVSVWGSDVFEFPKHGFLQKLVFKFNLKQATKIFSTSHVMAHEVSLYTNKKIEVVPFGVNLESFKPEIRKIDIFPADSIVVGTVKSLETKYGIQVLIKAFAKVKQSLNDPRLKLLIVGRGTKESEFRELAKQLGVANDSYFTGWAPVEKVPAFHNMIDIPVFPSICNESFGVSVVESAACEKAVIVTRKGGLPEVVQEGVTGLVVPADDVDALADAIETLIKNPELKQKMGQAGRERVTHVYDWKVNLEEMISHYNKYL